MPDGPLCGSDGPRYLMLKRAGGSAQVAHVVSEGAFQGTDGLRDAARKVRRARDDAGDEAWYLGADEDFERLGHARGRVEGREGGVLDPAGDAVHEVDDPGLDGEHRLGDLLLDVVHDPGQRATEGACEPAESEPELAEGGNR